MLTLSDDDLVLLMPKEHVKVMKTCAIQLQTISDAIWCNCEKQYWDVVDTFADVELHTKSQNSLAY